MTNYTTTLKAVMATGVGVEVFNENVGTGDSTATSYDLDNNNVVATSYTLKYAASGSNDFTDLTETTHYTLDNDGGKILLTTAGKTALSTNILYADYTHSPKVSETTLNSWLAGADEEVDNMTWNSWGTSTARTEYFDGRRTNSYATTDQPYAVDWDEPNVVQLRYKGMLSLTGAYFLSRGQALGQVERYDSVGVTYTDVTEEANSMQGTAFQPFADTTAANDYLYLGSSKMFHGFSTVLHTLGVTSGTNTLEYYNGSSWTALTTTESAVGVLNFSAVGKVSWDAPSGWTVVSVDSGTASYFVRVKANAVYTTQAKINSIYMDQDFVIDKAIPLYQMDADNSGKVTFLMDKIPNGTRNVRIDYNQGYASTPEQIVELASMIMGIRIAANITGGSYDDATSYSLPEGQISIGEVYVNVREVVNQFRKRIADILANVGYKMSVI